MKNEPNNAVELTPASVTPPANAGAAPLASVAHLRRYLFIPFVSLIFVIVHWAEAKTPFLRALGGAALIFVGMLLNPDGFR
jgi:hypothetical protein